MGEQMCSVATVCKRLEISRATLYRWIAKRGFPKPHPLGAQMVRFRVMEVEAWIAAEGQQVRVRSGDEQPA